MELVSGTPYRSAAHWVRPFFAGLCVYKQSYIGFSASLIIR